MGTPVVCITLRGDRNYMAHRQLQARLVMDRRSLSPPLPGGAHLGGLTTGFLLVRYLYHLLMIAYCSSH